MVTAVTVTVRQTHKLILCKLYTFYAKVIYFWSINHILISDYASHHASYLCVLAIQESIKAFVIDSWIGVSNSFANSIISL